MLSIKPCLAMPLLLTASAQLKAQSTDVPADSDHWLYGIQVSSGYFNFRNSLYVEIDLDPSGNLSEDWFEYAVKPWISLDYDTHNGTILVA